MTNERQESGCYRFSRLKYPSGKERCLQVENQEQREGWKEGRGE
jgi:hypothetical protein